MRTPPRITVDRALFSSGLGRCALPMSLALVVALAAPLTATAQEGKQFPDFLGFPASPDANAEGQWANTVQLVQPKRHTHYTRDEAPSVEAVSLARGIAELQYIRKVVQRAKDGATVYTWVDQPRQMVDSTNVDDMTGVIDQKLSNYCEASKKRGFAKLSKAFDAITDELVLHTLLEQSEGDLVWWDGAELHYGAIVENTFVVTHSENPDLTLIGKVTDRDTIDVQVWQSSGFSWTHPDDFATERLIGGIVWCARSGEEAGYAPVFGMAQPTWWTAWNMKTPCGTPMKLFGVIPSSRMRTQFDHNCCLAAR